MSSTFLRLGLWLLVLVMAAYILKETFYEFPLYEIIEDDLLLLILKMAGGIIVIGIALRFFERLSPGARSKCAECGAKVTGNAIYCRLHLNQVLEEEDLRHRTMNTRLPD